ncbi:MAG TPA: hypothetical protein DIT33_08415 [Pseudomonas sp.]|nr:hypothetical protein [Pseudomonas sp.]
MDFPPIIPKTVGKPSLTLPVARLNPLAQDYHDKYSARRLARKLVRRTYRYQHYLTIDTSGSTKQIHQLSGEVWAWQRYLYYIASKPGLKKCFQ